MRQTVANEFIQCEGQRFARLLDAAGVGRDAAVALLLPNIPEFLACYRGITWSGRTAVPVNRNLPAQDVAYVIANSGATALVAHPDYSATAQHVAAMIDPARRFAAGDGIDGFRRLDEMAAFSDTPLPEPRAGGLMLYTSGTTGQPKGVVSEALHVSITDPPGLASRRSMEMLQLFLRGEAPDTHLVAGPLYHAAPLSYCEGAALLGAPVAIMERWDAEEFLRAVHELRVHSTFLVPTHFVRLLKLPEAVRHRYDTSSLRLVFHGAAPVAPEIKRRMIEWLGPVLYEFYGGSEGMGSTAIASSDWLAHPGSVGRATPGCSLHILDDAGAPCPTGVEGTVYFRNEHQRFAYRGDSKKTAAAYCGELSTLGDIGYLDDDGYLFLCDRRADLVISGGVNVYPAQIEGVLLGHPEVLDCCVIGLPDPEWGERVLALVVPRDGAAADPQALRETLARFARERLAGYQQPREYVFADVLPRTEAGKLLRRQVRDEWRQRHASEHTSQES